MYDVGLFAEEKVVLLMSQLVSQWSELWNTIVSWMLDHIQSERERPYASYMSET